MKKFIVTQVYLDQMNALLERQIALLPVEPISDEALQSTFLSNIGDLLFCHEDKMAEYYVDVKLFSEHVADEVVNSRYDNAAIATYRTDKLALDLKSQTLSDTKKAENCCKEKIGPAAIGSFNISDRTTQLSLIKGNADLKAYDDACNHRFQLESDPTYTKGNLTAETARLKAQRESITRDIAKPLFLRLSEENKSVIKEYLYQRRIERIAKDTREPLAHVAIGSTAEVHVTEEQYACANLFDSSANAMITPDNMVGQIFRAGLSHATDQNIPAKRYLRVGDMLWLGVQPFLNIKAEHIEQILARPRNEGVLFDKHFMDLHTSLSSSLTIAKKSDATRISFVTYAISYSSNTQHIGGASHYENFELLKDIDHPGQYLLINANSCPNKFDGKYSIDDENLPDSIRYVIEQAQKSGFLISAVVRRHVYNQTNWQDCGPCSTQAALDSALQQCSLLELPQRKMSEEVSVSDVRMTLSEKIRLEQLSLLHFSPDPLMQDFVVEAKLTPYVCVAHQSLYADMEPVTVASVPLVLEAYLPAKLPVVPQKSPAKAVDESALTLAMEAASQTMLNDFIGFPNAICELNKLLSNRWAQRESGEQNFNSILTKLHEFTEGVTLACEVNQKQLVHAAKDEFDRLVDLISFCNKRLIMENSPPVLSAPIASSMQASAAAVQQFDVRSVNRDNSNRK